jgi:hypothetical protein
MIPSIPPLDAKPLSDKRGFALLGLSNAEKIGSFSHEVDLERSVLYLRIEYGSLAHR